MRLDWELARRGYRRYAAYPAATVAGVFTNTVFGFMKGYILLAMFQHRDSIGGYDATDTITYTWLAQGLIATIYIWGWRDLALRIRTGDIAVDLSRPLDPLRTGLAYDLGRALYHAIWRGLPPLLVGAFAFELTKPSSLAGAVAFVASVALAVGVSFAWRFLYNVPAFWLLHYRGVMVMAIIVASLFSGFIVPIAFFPDWLQTVAYATPFPSMVQVPIDIFVGTVEGAEIVKALAIQAGWLLALLLACRTAFAAGTRKLVVQGG
jgi:viologen exporter family transport system permease protein